MRNEKDGFTLVELLIVIVIIVILMGLLLSVLPGAISSAKEASAKSIIQGLSVALGEYYNFYSTYPPDDGTAPSSAKSANLVTYLSSPSTHQKPFYTFNEGSTNAAGIISPVSSSDYFRYRNNFIRTPKVNHIGGVDGMANKYGYDIWCLNSQGLATPPDYNSDSDFTAKTVHNW